MPRPTSLINRPEAASDMGNRHSSMIFWIAWVAFGLLLSPASSRSAHSPEGVQPALSQEPIQPLPLKNNLDTRKVLLGHTLFQDPILSRNNRLACSSCHDLDGNGADEVAYSTGIDGLVLTINTLTVFNSGLNHRLFWDGRADSLEDQINYVITHPKEFDTTWPEVVDRLRKDPGYLSTFKKLYSDGITADNIREAIATFERSLIKSNSRFDQFLRGDIHAINAEEKAGYQLFKSYGCTACHQGANVGGNLFMRLGVFGDYFSDRGNITEVDYGRMNVTGREQDRHVFRVPSLRYVAKTAPYFHDGSAKTLEDAVKIMAKYQLGRRIEPKDVTQIIAFLKTLSPDDVLTPLSNGSLP